MKIYQRLLILFLPIVVILSNFLFLANNHNIYDSIYKKEKIYKNFQSKIEVENATKALLGYFRGNNQLDINFYSTQAQIHLRDVKKLIKITQLIDIVAVISLVTTIAWMLYKKDFSGIKKSVVISTTLIFALIALIAILLLSNFDKSFIIFHKILFKNDFWLFPPEDNLIKLFPEAFFIAFAKQLAMNILVSQVVLLFLTNLLPKNDPTTN